MALDYSPFLPGKPAPFEIFVGRDDELRRLKRHVESAARGQLQVAYISGERGIGKSSLASYVRSYAEQHCNMVGAHVFLGGAKSLQDMTRRVFERIITDGTEKKWYSSISKLFGKTVESADIFGLKIQFTPSEKELDALVRNFGTVVNAIIEKLRHEKRAIGLFLILDDINGLASSQEFADWMKSLIDEIAVSGRQTALCLLVVGLPERRQSLVELNPSLARAFDLFDLEPWAPVETRKFFAEAFEKVRVSVDDAAMNIMVQYAGGLPLIAHEIGDAAFSEDTDGKIDAQDASRGIIKACDIIGRRHLRQQVLDEIRSTKYKAILHQIAKAVPLGTITFERANIISLLPEESKNVDNFLRRMKELGVIYSGSEGPGSYRFASYIHHLFIYIYMGGGTEKSKKKAT